MAQKLGAWLHLQPFMIISLIAVVLPTSTNAHTVVDPYHFELNQLQSDNEVGFRMKVTHTDAPSSPFSKRQASRAELHGRLVERDFARVDAIGKHVRDRKKPRHHSSKAASPGNGASLKDPVKSGLSSGTGQYFVTLRVGTPPKDVIATIDTGSDVFWLQCEPCQQCYQQIGPIFNPSGSSSFTTLKCASPVCTQLQVFKCGKQSQNCLYVVAYGDGSVSVGDFSQDTLTLTSTSGRPYSFPNFAFGCGHVQSGLFVGSGGVLGLGRGKLSFLTQVGSTVGNRFSYCLTDRFVNPEANSHIFFGGPTSGGLQYTPLTQNPQLPAFYYVGLTGITVGKTVISFPASLYTLDSTGNGGVILDSGTSITRIVEPSYSTFRDSFRAATGHLKRVEGDSLFDTCYTVTDGITNIPAVNLLFQNKATLVLPANNVLLPIDSKGTYCLAFAPSYVNISIIGNVQQQNFRIEYDLANSRIGFESADCATV